MRTSQRIWISKDYRSSRAPRPTRSRDGLTPTNYQHNLLHYTTGTVGALVSKAALVLEAHRISQRLLVCVNLQECHGGLISENGLRKKESYLKNPAPVPPVSGCNWLQLRMIASAGRRKSRNSRTNVPVPVHNSITHLE